jgi:uncharacterized membrane protein YraQ (UPF0718 family)
MTELLVFTLAALAVSLAADRKKTWTGVKMGIRMLMNMLPPFITVLIAVAFALAMLPEETLTSLLGEGSGVFGFFTAALIGAVALIPGFVSYPLSALLLKNGVSYAVVSVFITTLMMVGIVTLPLERRYFGWRVALTRNALCFIGALVIGAVMSLLWRLL